MPRTAKVSKNVKAKPVQRVARTSKAKSSVKKNAALERAIRGNFVAIAVLVAAGLIAIAAGMSPMGETTARSTNSLSAYTGSKPSLFLKTVGSQELKIGSTVSVVLYENSGNQPVNTVQSAIQYPAESLEVVNVTTADHFTQEAATDTSTPGLIRIARAVTAGSPSVTGVKPVAVVQFKLVQEPSNKLSLGIDMLSSLLVRSSDNKNIL